MRLKAAGLPEAGGYSVDALDLVELHARLGEVYETRLGGHGPEALRVYRVIFDRLDAHTTSPPSEALARIYRSPRRINELYEVYGRDARERRRETPPRRRSRGEDRPPVGGAPGTTSAGNRHLEAVLDLRGEDPRGARQPSRTCTRGSRRGPSLSTSWSVRSTSPRTTTSA